eukprot:355353-Chlamydomonas_euryale.AAC.6
MGTYGSTVGAESSSSGSRYFGPVPARPECRKESPKTAKTPVKSSEKASMKGRKPKNTDPPSLSSWLPRGSRPSRPSFTMEKLRSRCPSVSSGMRLWGGGARGRARVLLPLKGLPDCTCLNGSRGGAGTASAQHTNKQRQASLETALHAHLAGSQPQMDAPASIARSHNSNAHEGRCEVPTGTRPHSTARHMAAVWKLMADARWPRAQLLKAADVQTVAPCASFIPLV